jgi:hypothetical protein
MPMASVMTCANTSSSTYEINVLWDPSPKGYRSRTNVPFGRPVRIPAPFDFDLDTSGFAVPEDESAADEQR